VKIGVVSDTHGSVVRLRPAATMLESLEVDVVLHCGDVGSAAVVEAFSRWPAHFVRGNCDFGLEADLSAACVGNAVWQGEFASLELGGLRIALLHGDDERRQREALSSGEFDFVCVGHTHVAQTRKVGETTLFNPGALYRTSSPSIGLIDCESCTAHVIRIE
jgi:putative phosphoesterase